jgi:putative redox protein
MKTRVNWINKFHLDGETETGHRIQMDSVPAGNESKGPTPKELLLQALAGCTMMDVVSILEKSRKHVEKFWIDVDGELAKDHPKVFTRINLKYNLIGQDLDDKTVERAIELSREKYCPVFGMLKTACEITYSYAIYSAIEYINQVLEDNFKN